MKLNIAFSSCPNDTYIFDALVHKKIDTHGIDFSYTIADVEELNKKALEQTFAITKLSYFAYAHCSQAYQILDSGSALGYANGPLFICKQGHEHTINSSSVIAIPGKHTTAHVLFSMAYPEFSRKKYMVFNEIEEAIKNGSADAGVIIHENRFTYAQRGFSCMCDLGTVWEQNTTMPIPLGAICIQRSLPESVKQTVNTLIRKSIEFARSHPDESQHFIHSHAQEIEQDIVSQHIALFVNDFSIDLGTIGKQAIVTLFSKAREFSLIPNLHPNIFLNPSS